MMTGGFLGGKLDEDDFEDELNQYGSLPPV